MMIIVNRYFLGLITDEITGMANDDSVDDRYPNLDPNNKKDVMNFIRNEMQLINILSDKSKNILKHTLIYYCYFDYDVFDWEQDFYSMMPPFAPPDKAVDFYKWYYEVYFGEIDLGYINNLSFLKVEDTSIFDIRNKIWYL